MTKRSGRSDLNQLAAAIVTEATNDDLLKAESVKDKDAEKTGRLGGLKGGRARADKLTQEQRSDIARMAALARWKKSDC